jgi:hypothetical protein
MIAMSQLGVVAAIVASTLSIISCSTGSEEFSDDPVLQKAAEDACETADGMPNLGSNFNFQHDLSGDFNPSFQDVGTFDWGYLGSRTAQKTYQFVCTGRFDDDHRYATAMVDLELMDPPKASAPTGSESAAPSSPAPSPYGDSLEDLGTWTGRWGGPVTGDSSAYDVAIDLTAREGILTGRIEYPQLDCSGEVTQIDVDGSTVTMSEVIQDGTANCIDSGELTLRQEDGRLHYRYLSSPKDISATLERKE